MAQNQDISLYIQEQMRLNVSNETIVKNLKSVGWSDEAILNAFKIVAVPQAPNRDATSTPAITEQESVNSPYSSLLAIVLTVSLFVLMNGIFSDIKTGVQNVNTMLLYEGFFVIPFLLIAFLIHSSFKEDSKRFKILSLPYFAISAYILCRLLWQVGENLLRANSAIGIYVVLGMIILVLTGVIIFVQKYIKE